MVLIQKSHKTVANVGTDPLDGDSLVRPLCEDGVVGSVLQASSRGDRQFSEHAGNATIHRLVSQHVTCLTIALELLLTNYLSAKPGNDMEFNSYQEIK